MLAETITLVSGYTEPSNGLGTHRNRFARLHELGFKLQNARTTAGIVGHGIVRTLLAETDTTVIALVRQGTETPTGSDVHPRLTIVPGVADDGSMDSLLQMLKGAIGDRQIDHVVSCFGGKTPRKLLTTMEDEDVLASAERALPHLRLLKAVTPLIRNDPSSSYTFVTGMLGERCFMPDRLTGMTLSNGILYSMIVAFRSELQATGKTFRVRELRIGSMLHKSDNKPEKDISSASHPSIPASSVSTMMSFSSDLVGKFLCETIANDREEHIIRLQDEQFRDKV